MMEAKQCPHAVYPYECFKNDCQGCNIKLEEEAKISEGKSEYFEPSYRHLMNEVLGIRK